MSDLYLCGSCEEPFCGSCWEPCQHGKPICQGCSGDPSRACWECVDDIAGQRELDHLRGK